MSENVPDNEINCCGYSNNININTIIYYITILYYTTNYQHPITGLY